MTPLLNNGNRRLNLTKASDDSSENGDEAGSAVDGSFFSFTVDMKNTFIYFSLNSHGDSVIPFYR